MNGTRCEYSGCNDLAGESCGSCDCNLCSAHATLIEEGEVQCSGCNES